MRAADAADDRRPERPPGRARVLCLTDDAELRAHLAQTVDAAQGQVVVRGAADGDREWSAADLVLLDAGVAGAVAHLPHRTGVVVVTWSAAGGSPGDSVWRLAVAVGAEHVVVLPEAQAWLQSRVRRAGAPGARLVAVVGARGGAGATAAAVALASTAAAMGSSVLLLDDDELAGGLDLALGAEDLPGLHWPDLADVSAPLPPGGLRAALPTADGVILLSHARRSGDGPAVTARAVAAVLGAARCEHDLVVVDCARQPGPVARQVLGDCHLVVCVVPLEVRAAAAAAAVLGSLPLNAPVRLLLRGPAPGGLTADDTEAMVRAGLVGSRVALQGVDRVRGEPGLAAAMDRGEPFAVAARSPLRRWAHRLLAEPTVGNRADVLAPALTGALV